MIKNISEDLEGVICKNKNCCHERRFHVSFSKIPENGPKPDIKEKCNRDGCGCYGFVNK